MLRFFDPSILMIQRFGCTRPSSVKRSIWQRFSQPGRSSSWAPALRPVSIRVSDSQCAPCPVARIPEARRQENERNLRRVWSSSAPRTAPPLRRIWVFRKESTRTRWFLLLLLRRLLFVDRRPISWCGREFFLQKGKTLK